MTDEQIAEWAEMSRRHLIEERCATAKSLVEHDLSELDLYLHTMEKFIEQSEARAVESLAPHSRGKDDGEFWAEYYPVEWQQVMGAYLRRSFIVALFSVVETHLPRAVDHAGVIVRAPLQPDDLAGNLLKKSAKFLSAFAKLQAPTAKDWETLNDLYAVRNSVAHGPGWVRFAQKLIPEPDGFVRWERGEPVGSDKRIAALASRAPGLTIDHNGFIELEPEFPRWALGTVGAFFVKLFRELEAVCDRTTKFETPR